jgi:ABC-type transport system involved in multi-copper enzyme maturation permease subunit
MEYEIPSLVVILLALILIGVLSKVNSTVLLIIVLVTLVLAGYQHANLFTYEYASSTWQNIAAAYSNVILIVIVTLMIIGFALNLVKRGVSSASQSTRSMYPTQTRSSVVPPSYGLNTIKSMVRDPFKSR